MGLESGRLGIANSITSLVSNFRNASQGIVYKVILDENDEVLKQKNIKGTYALGAVQFRLITDKTTSDELLPLAFPIDKNSNTLPIRNEQIFIYNNNGDYYYSRTAEEANPLISALPNLISTKFPSDTKQQGGNSNTYQNVSETGISRTSSSNNQSKFDGFGNYYKKTPAGTTIHKLRLYEGDSLIQSRFGQSIRLSGYNNSENELYPTIIIRNGENSESLKNDSFNTTIEDINNDGGIICLSSGERLLEYTLPVQNKKESFFNYPNELKGNQILLNSDRLIFSAKTSEMIFASKRDVGFITDGQFSIDATQGINITTDWHIFVDTKNRDINFNIGNGTIALGTDGELEAAVKGETLKDILYDFMVIVAQQIFVTPSGPTAPGPTNNPQINSLVARLNDMLSNNVQLK